MNNPVASMVNNIPGVRGMSKIVYVYFVNFADLLLFNYHDRDFNFIVNSTFATIRNLEQEKFSIINVSIIGDFIRFNFE